jgi:hypothetical protein
MGLYIFSYGINTAKIKSLFGSKDQEALKNIQESLVYQDYEDGYLPPDYKTDTKKALEDIINGEEFDAHSNASYGYALIAICSTLGNTVPYPEEIKLGYATDLINKYLNEDFELNDIVIEDMLFMEDSNPFEIPEIADFPSIGFLTHLELSVLQELLQPIKITDQDMGKIENSGEKEGEIKAFMYEQIRGIIQNIDYCIENNLDLVSFCH